MIYPYEIPDNVESHAEKAIFNQLYSVKDNYDIFYSRSFLGRAPKERKEYEIDFIIAEKPKRRGKCSAIICLEVKGGIIEYNGERSEWIQNGSPLAKGPDKQASSASHSLVKRYPVLAREVPIDWALCFPDCELPSNTPLPPNLDYNRIIDKKSILYIDHAITSMLVNAKKSYNKPGCNIHVYESFKKDLLRGIGFVETLSTKFKYEDNRFIQLTNTQVEFFNQLAENNNILVSGYAGTGKTVIAIAAAQEKLNEGKTVLFLCFNRTLANKIRYRFDKYDDRIKVATFHSLARSIIDKKEPEWFEQQQNKNDDDFWDIEVPIKLSSLMEGNDDVYDSIIIDEGQDFKERWFELIFKMCNKDGYKYVFTDPMQDIFNRNYDYQNIPDFFRINLIKNCRNTKNIVKYLSEISSLNIESHIGAPKGELVTEKIFNNENELNNQLTNDIISLIKKHGLRTDQILVMLDKDKRVSPLNGINKIGKYPFVSLNRSGRFDRDTIHFTSIRQFKGLEIDVLFLINTNILDNKESIKKLYTQISRGKNKVYLYSTN